MQQNEIHFRKLTELMINIQVIDDINLLLIQLAPEAEPCTEEWLQQVIGEGADIFVASDNTHIIGIVLLRSTRILVGRKNWIEDLIVDKEYQGRGIASRLLDMAENTLRERGDKDVNLTSGRSRVTARQMYQRRGYQLRDSDLFRKIL